MLAALCCRARMRASGLVSISDRRRDHVVRFGLLPRGFEPRLAESLAPAHLSIHLLVESILATRDARMCLPLVRSRLRRPLFALAGILSKLVSLSGWSLTILEFSKCRVPKSAAGFAIPIKNCPRAKFLAIIHLVLVSMRKALLPRAKSSPTVLASTRRDLRGSSHQQIRRVE